MKASLLDLYIFLGKKFFFKRKLFYFAIIFCALAQGFAVLLPVVTAKMISVFQNGADTNSFLTTPIQGAVLFLIFGVASLIASISSGLLDRTLQNSVISDMKYEIHQKILMMRADYFKNVKQAECLMNVESASQTTAALQSILLLPVMAIFGIIPAFAALFESLKSANIPSWLMFILVPCIFLQPVIGFWLGNIVNKLYSNLRKSAVDVNKELINSFSMPLEVRLLNAHKVRGKSLSKALNILKKKTIKAQATGVFEGQLATSFIFVIQLIIAFFAALNYSPENKNMISGIVQCFLLIPTIFSQISSLIASYTQQKQSEVETRIVYEILNSPSAFDEDKNKKPVSFLEPPAIKFDNISFEYEQDKPVLNDLSLNIPKGKTVAVVSRSGGGKSTLFNLLSSLYGLKTGNIYINDKNIKDISLNDLYSTISRISQFPLFIDGSLRDNFYLQKENANDEEIIKTLKKTGIFDLIQKTNPDNPLEFPLTLGAENLSGGQKRLLSISRSLIGQSKIIIIDEPTTGVDAQAVGNFVLPVLKSFKENTTMILIDHNMNFVRNLSDYVAILENGKITEFALTEEVWNNENSLFRKLWEEYNKNSNNE